MCLIRHCVLRFHRYCPVFLLFASLTVSGQTHSEQVLLIGTIQNRTGNPGYDGIHLTLHKLLADLPRFPRTVLDTQVRIDSFPDEPSFLRARSINASYILWGRIVNSHPGPGISLHILDMKQASVSHITMMIDRDDNRGRVAETVRSKLQLWLRRTTMIQLIITTRPAAVTVLLDGKTMGSTPYEGMVQPGTYRLELKKSPFLPVRMPVSFISGNTYQYDFSLNQKMRKTDRRSVVRWLGISLACLGAGGIAHWQYDRAREQYLEAVPPADFNRLHNRAVALNIGRSVLFSAGGTALGVMIFRVIF
jgi:hypothetical protein